LRAQNIDELQQKSYYCFPHDRFELPLSLTHILDVHSISDIKGVKL